MRSVSRLTSIMFIFCKEKTLNIIINRYMGLLPDT